MNDLEIRRAVPADRSRVLALLRASLGWADDRRHEELFAWKHDANPFGPSPAWVALDGERIAGFRTFMRWELRLDGEIVRAVRAVDTATHPDYQGRGVFRRLTLHALEELGAEGVAFVFNTPNRASLPGYLRMGWRQVGRLPVRVRPRGLRALTRMARARVPADRWPVQRDAVPGIPAGEVIGDGELVGGLLGALPAAPGFRTNRTPAYVAWRYGLGTLGYRALLRRDDPRDGFLVFRLRGRRPALEAAVVDALGTGWEAARPSPVGALVSEAGADYAISLGAAMPGGRSLRLPRQGPVLAWRGLAWSVMPPLGRWTLSLGDVELF